MVNALPKSRRRTTRGAGQLLYPLETRSEDKEGVAQKERAAYYNLPRLGVASYRCEAVTEWGVMLAGEADPEALKKNGGTEILNGIHIWMTIGKSGDPKFEQRLDGPISDPKRKAIVDTLVRKPEKVLTSFARDATRYMFTSMIPSPDQSYKLEEKDGRYVISESEGSSTANFTVEKDYRISEFNVSLAKSNVKMNPQFIKTSGGYLLSGQHTEVKSSVPGRIQRAL
jgi:hypothetical protein